MHNTFERRKRLSQSKRFQYIFQKAPFFWKHNLKIYFCANQEKYARIGIIVPKKVVSLSTKRHHIKRLVREYFRMHQSQIKGYDILLLFRKPPEHSQTILQVALDQIWDQIEKRIH